MSNTALQSITLQSAIILQVKEFASTNRPFSVHNITQEIRSKVNSGTLEIPEVEVPGASFRFDIPHVMVKALFDELWRTGAFTPDFTLNRQFNGTYFEYTPTLVAQAATVAPATTVTATTAGVSRSVAKDRISQYLGNCRNRNFRPTLKQVQSAIKRGEISTGWTCEEIQVIVENDLGYTVTANPDLVSASQVII